MIEKGVCSGQGGQGMVLIGNLIAESALIEGLEASIYPSYGPEMRGGAAHSSYVISDDIISNPIVSDFDVAIVMNNYSIAQFVCSQEKMIEREELKKKGMNVDDRRLKNGGVLIYNSSLITPEEVAKNDLINVYAMPASKLTKNRISNMVLLGAYMQVKGKPKFETLESIFHEVFTGKKAKFIDGNLKDLKRGMDYIINNYKI